MSISILLQSAETRFMPGFANKKILQDPESGSKIPTYYLIFADPECHHKLKLAHLFKF